jgi:hypothetical protein
MIEIEFKWWQGCLLLFCACVGALDVGVAAVKLIERLL